LQKTRRSGEIGRNTSPSRYVVSSRSSNSRNRRSPASSIRRITAVALRGYHAVRGWTRPSILGTIARSASPNPAISRIASTVRNGRSHEQTNAPAHSGGSASRAVRMPRSGPSEATGSATTRMCGGIGGRSWPNELEMTIGEQTTETVSSVRSKSGRSSKGRRALGWPIREECPPQRMTPANIVCLQRPTSDRVFRDRVQNRVGSFAFRVRCESDGGHRTGRLRP